MSDLLRRAKALAATQKKVRGKALDWSAGMTCVHMARFHLRQMGHRPDPLPRIRSLIGARRALSQRGCADVIELLDAQPGLSRIAPAMMLPGDLAVLASEEGIGSIFVCAGPHKLIGWREDVAEAVVLDLSFDNITAAWRA